MVSTDALLRFAVAGLIIGLPSYWIGMENT